MDYRIKKHLLLSFLCSLFFLFFSCDKKDTSAEPSGEGIPIHRFENVLFAADLSDLKASLLPSYEEYKPMYSAPLDDSLYLMTIRLFAQDPDIREAYERVRTKYPSLGWLSSSLGVAFDTIRSAFPELPLPRIYSLIVGPNDFSSAYNYRVVASPEYVAFSIDLYSINQLKDLEYYNFYPQYMMQILDSAFLAPDIVFSYLSEIFPDRSPFKDNFLAEIISRGKRLYAVKKCLPWVSDASILRYSEEELAWCQANEPLLWAYCIRHKLLYETDNSIYRPLLAEGLTTKGFEGSPARLADYLGWQIVKAYAEKNPLSLKQTLSETIDDIDFLKKSAYKPKNRK